MAGATHVKCMKCEVVNKVPQVVRLLLVLRLNVEIIESSMPEM